MNKLNILIFGLVVFAAVAQFVSAEGGLVSELDDEDIDEELEGGGFRNAVKTFKSAAARTVGVDVEDQYGRDIQNPEVGQSVFAEPRKRECVGKNTEKACESCCRTLNKSHKMGGRRRSHCVCLNRDNHYSVQPLSNEGFVEPEAN